MAFRKDKAVGGPTYGGNVNIWLNKSKDMTEEELTALQDAHPKQLPQQVVLFVVDAELADHSNLRKGSPGVLLAVDLKMDEFSSGAIGYKYRLNREAFTE